MAHVEEGNAVMNCSEKILKFISIAMNYSILGNIQLPQNFSIYLAPAFTLSLLDNSTPLMAELGGHKRLITIIPHKYLWATLDI